MTVHGKILLASLGIVLIFSLGILVGKSLEPEPSLSTDPATTSGATKVPTSEPVIPSPTVTPSSAKTVTRFPAQVLDLTNWKLTLPIGSSEKPTEVKQPVLAKYALDPWFIVPTGVSAVRFRAPVNSVTTSGSNYPRSELREMINDGNEQASWSSTTGTHTMFLDQAITAAPQKKKHVVAGQIHDANDDVIVIRLEQPNLHVDVNGDTMATLDKNYILGKRFTVRFVVNNGKTSVYYNGSTTPSYVLEKDYSDAYFKAGAYTQANCEKEDPSSCSDSNYGEVMVYSLSVSHQ